MFNRVSGFSDEAGIHSERYEHPWADRLRVGYRDTGSLGSPDTTLKP